jgi:AcrR family transcriptional regulator
MELFASRGYDGVGVQEIVEAAGVTKPTLYHHFGSKQGLLEALLSSRFEPLAAAVEKAAEYHGDLPRTLRALAGAWLGFARENPVYYRLHLSLFFAPADGEAFRAAAGLNERLFTLLEDLFASAARQHGNMKGRQRMYAATFLGFVNNCAGLALNGYLQPDPHLVDRMVHQFEHGIYS